MNTLRVKLPHLKSRSVSDTGRIGRALAKQIAPGLLILLHGDLGAGKTALAIEIGKALGAPHIKSPSFAIESVYTLPAGNFSLVHADLYRLEETRNTALQLEEYIEDGQAVLVEWGGKWKDAPSDHRWDIEIFEMEDGSRVLNLSACGERAAASLSRAYAEVVSCL